MNSGVFKFQRRIGLWVLMISAGLGSYGLGLYQGSAFRMQRNAATESRKEPVRILASPAIPEVVPVAAQAAQSSKAGAPTKAIVPTKAASSVPAPSPKPTARRDQAPKAAPAVIPAAAATAATTSPQPEPSLQPSSISDSPDNIQSPM